MPICARRERLLLVRERASREIYVAFDELVSRSLGEGRAREGGGGVHLDCEGEVVEMGGEVERSFRLD